MAADAGVQAPVVLLGRYRLGAVLGVGGMATVYRARDQLLGRDVAVKLFAPTGADEQELRKQEAEARLLASLSMHGLVTLLDAGVETGPQGSARVFLVMELVEGRDLRALLQRGALPLRTVAHIGFDLAEALEYVHGQGLVHRDLKPANVLLLDFGLERRPRVKLADFGIAAIVGRATLQQGEFTTGTAAYLSPEQAAGEPVGQPSDVYSLGLVLLECITGRAAFPGPVIDSALARLERAPDLSGDLPESWRSVLTPMFARDPARRPKLGDLADAFRLLVVDETGRHRDAEHGAGSDASRQTGTREPAARPADPVPPDTALPDAAPDATFDRITALTARVLHVPVAALSVADAGRTWFRSSLGLDLAALGPTGIRDIVRKSEHLVVIPDLLADPRTVDDVIARPPVSMRFAAAMPLLDDDGQLIGMLAVCGPDPRELTAGERATLADLAAIVVHEMALRRAVRRAVLATD